MFTMTYRQHRLDPRYPGPEVVTTKSSAPPVVVLVWCDLVARMDRRTLNRFTKDIWARFGGSAPRMTACPPLGPLP